MAAGAVLAVGRPTDDLYEGRDYVAHPESQDGEVNEQEFVQLVEQVVHR